MIPVAIAPVIEHIGDVYAINEVTGKDFVKEPGLHRTMLGDTRNLIIVSLILILGIGGAELTFGSFTIGGIGLATLVGVILNLIIPQKKYK